MTIVVSLCWVVDPLFNSGRVLLNILHVIRQTNSQKSMYCDEKVIEGENDTKCY